MQFFIKIFNNKIEKIDRLKLMLRFFKELTIFDRFKYNFIHDKNHPNNIKKICQSLSENELKSCWASLDCSFGWSNTKEKFWFWNIIYFYWNYLLDEKEESYMALNREVDAFKHHQYNDVKLRNFLNNVINQIKKNISNV